MKVLIVDDSPANRKLLRVTLEAEGIETLDAGDGVEALAVLERDQVDAVICDILMPNLDGYGFCIEIRKDRRHRTLPVILYTSTYTSSTDRDLALKVGADGYLQKPAPSAEIVAALNAATVKARKHKPADSAGGMVVMQQYNQVLVTKLEGKNADLERAVRELKTAHHGILKLNRELEERVRQRTGELEKRNRELAAALSQVKELSGLLPICSYCKRIRDDGNYWHRVEHYIAERTRAEFSHGVCPECLEQYIRKQISAPPEQGRAPGAAPNSNSTPSDENPDC